MARVWCVRYRNKGGDREAWCAVAGNVKPDEDATSVPTKCGHFVILPLGTSKREVERRAKEVIRPFAENACGGDGNGFLDVPNEHAARFHDLSNPTSPTLLEAHFRAARDLYRALSEREGQDG